MQYKDSPFALLVPAFLVRMEAEDSRTALEAGYVVAEGDAAQALDREESPPESSILLVNPTAI
jgi:hypothetical protein